jgi:hypothetical protein
MSQMDAEQQDEHEQVDEMDVSRFEELIENLDEITPTVCTMLTSDDYRGATRRLLRSRLLTNVLFRFPTRLWSSSCSAAALAHQTCARAAW